MTFGYGERAMFTCGSFFSGMGGMDYAFAAAGFDTRWQIEKDAFCRRKLRSLAPGRWPNAVQLKDIKHVRGREIEAVDVVFGGPPCQPYSVAGERRGAGDDRHLWPEMFRIICELAPRPKCILIENVAGMLSLVCADILSDLESAGYTSLPPLVIPACAVGAPHRRDRAFILAYASGYRYDQQTAVKDAAQNSQRNIPAYQQGGRSKSDADFAGGEAVAYSSVTRLALRQGFRHYARAQWQAAQRSSSDAGDGYGRTQSRLGIDADGLSSQLAGHAWPAFMGPQQYEWEPPRTAPPGTVKERKSKVQAIGNAVVPQVVYPLALAIRRFLTDDNL